MSVTSRRPAAFAASLSAILISGSSRRGDLFSKIETLVHDAAGLFVKWVKL